MAPSTVHRRIFTGIFSGLVLSGCLFALDDDAQKKIAQTEAMPHLYSPTPTPLSTTSPVVIKEISTMGTYQKPTCPTDEGYTINFSDISIVELIQFISKISGRNYIYDSRDLIENAEGGRPFIVSIVSEDPTSVADLSAALLQILKMHGLSVVEQGNNVIIFKNNSVSRVSTVITEENVEDECSAVSITRVFRLYNIDPSSIVDIITPLLSQDAIIRVADGTRHLIISDITANVNKIADLLNALDTPNSAFDINEYVVQSSDPAALVAYAKQILGAVTQEGALQLIAQPSSKKIFIISTPYLIQRARQVLESLDSTEVVEMTDLPAHTMANNTFFMYKLKYQSGQEIGEALNNIGTNLQSTQTSNLDFINAIYSAQWLQVNNSIVVTGTQDAITKVVELLEELDIQPVQVYVEVLIIDTTLRNSLDFGVQWIALGDEQNKLAYATGLLSTPPPDIQGTNTTNPGARYVAANPIASPPSIPNPGRDVPLPLPGQLNGFTDLTGQTSAFGLGIIGNILRHNGTSFLTLGALLTALEEEADTSIVLNPRIMIQDTQSAHFFVGQNIPYQTTSTVIQQTGSVTQNIQYEDIGVDLTVTPTVSPNDLVTLQITQTIQDVASTTGSLTPTTTKTQASTRVHVPSGTFLVMSGHVRDVVSCVHSGIPCLGSLPLVGPAFSRTVESRTKRNLIFFLRPVVIRNIQDGIKITNQEGYDFNWETNPCSLLECGIETAPECETYPPPECPDH